MDEGADGEEQKMVKRFGSAPEAFDLPGCVQEPDGDPNGRAPCASRSPSRDGKWAQRGFHAGKRNKKKR